jgi:hypothetical protein
VNSRPVNMVPGGRMGSHRVAKSGQGGSATEAGGSIAKWGRRVAKPV